MFVIKIFHTFCLSSPIFLQELMILELESVQCNERRVLFYRLVSMLRRMTGGGGEGVEEYLKAFIK